MKKSYIAPAQTVINFNAEQAILTVSGTVGIDSNNSLDASKSYSGKKDYSSQIWGED